MIDRTVAERFPEKLVERDLLGDEPFRLRFCQLKYLCHNMV